MIRRGSARRGPGGAGAGAGLAAATAAAVTAVLAAPARRPARPACAGFPGHAGCAIRPPAVSAPGGPGPAAAAGVVAAVWPGGRAVAALRSATSRTPAPAACRPFLLNGTDADLLPDAAPVPGAVGGLAFLSEVPGQPGTGSRGAAGGPVGQHDHRPAARRARLTARPVTVRACGRTLRLAGFAYPGARVAGITVYAGAQVVSAIPPPAPATWPRAPSRPGGPAAPGTGGPAGRTLRPVPGVWQHLWRPARPRRAPRSGTGRSAGAPPGGSPCCWARTASAAGSAPTAPTGRRRRQHLRADHAAAGHGGAAPAAAACRFRPGRLRGAAAGPGRLAGGHPGRGRRDPGRRDRGGRARVRGGGRPGGASAGPGHRLRRGRPGAGTAGP